MTLVKVVGQTIRDYCDRCRDLLKWGFAVAGRDWAKLQVKPGNLLPRSGIRRLVDGTLLTG